MPSKYKKTALIELYAHSEVLYHFCHFYQSQNHQLQIFTNDFIYEDAYDYLKNSPQIQWFTRTENQSRSHFIREHLHEINSCDQVVFITLVSDFKFFAQLKISTFSTLIIHNAVSYLRPYKGIHLTLSAELGMDLLRLAKFFLKRDGYWKQQMLANFDEICFPTATIQQYVEQQGWTKKYNIGEVMPFANSNLNGTGFRNLSRFSEKTKITITIPGTINKNSRDYEMVYRAFQQLLQQTHPPIRLVLLGSPKGHYGHKMIKLFQSLARATFQVISFTESVPQEAFDEWMQQTDVLILPLRKYLKLGIYREMYGYTNVSGGVNDAIKFNVPALLPAYYPLEKASKKNIEKFKDVDDLTKKLLDKINNPFPNNSPPK